MDGAKRNVQRTKDLLLKAYAGDELNRYPSRLEKDPNVKIKEEGGKKRKEKGKPTKTNGDQRPRGAYPRFAGLAALLQASHDELEPAGDRDGEEDED